MDILAPEATFGASVGVHFFQDCSNVTVVVVVVAVAVVAVVVSIQFDRMQETAGSSIFEKKIRKIRTFGRYFHRRCRCCRLQKDAFGFIVVCIIVIVVVVIFSVVLIVVVVVFEKSNMFECIR